jgi:hypothetical protein
MRLVVTATWKMVDQRWRRSRWRVVSWRRLWIVTRLPRDRRKREVVTSVRRKESLQWKRRWWRNQPSQPITSVNPTGRSSSWETATRVWMRVSEVTQFVASVEKRCASVCWITNATTAVEISTTAIEAALFRTDDTHEEVARCASSGAAKSV